MIQSTKNGIFLSLILLILLSLILAVCFFPHWCVAIFLATLAILLSCIVIIIALNQKLQRTERTLQDTLIELRHMQIGMPTTPQEREQVLIRQLDPHFLYNSLESIRGMAYLEGNEKIGQIIGDLSAYFRYSISAKNNVVTLAEEVKSIDKYFQILQFRFGDRYLIKKDFSLSEPCWSYGIPKLALQVLVENAISHGFQSMEGPGEIILRIREDSERMTVSVRDNGVGMPPERFRQVLDSLREPAVLSSHSENHNGTALINLQARVQMYFGHEYGIDLFSVQDVGTEVRISLPKKAPCNR